MSVDNTSSRKATLIKVLEELIDFCFLLGWDKTGFEILLFLIWKIFVG